MADRESYAQTQIPSAIASIPYPDVKTLIQGYLAQMGEVFCGTVEGTGASIDVETPFDPAIVIVWNQDDPTLGVYLPSMTAAHMLKLTDAPALTHPTSLGITVGVKTFRIGADTDLNVAAETLHYVAIGARKANGSL